MEPRTPSPTRLFLGPSAWAAAESHLQALTDSTPGLSENFDRSKLVSERYQQAESLQASGHAEVSRTHVREGLINICINKLWAGDPEQLHPFGITAWMPNNVAWKFGGGSGRSAPCNRAGREARCNASMRFARGSIFGSERMDAVGCPEATILEFLVEAAELATSRNMATFLEMGAIGRSTGPPVLNQHWRPGAAEGYQRKRPRPPTSLMPGSALEPSGY
ncbi:unnamed protein product [Phytophthora fragariaefolia]|uniref:Unnamed protein product n=1 Tax=Phytophthora fragariaefolia TaxID=1490495 RepID=A0A9W7CZ62_9STRA|nr:unnamed protein product [Phytophthora fragariaefolia]